MSFNCPHCAKELGASLVSKIEAKNTVHMKFSYGGTGFEARTLAGMISSFSKLYCGVAKQHGVKAVVYVNKINQVPGEVDIEFLVATNSSK